MDKMDVTDAGMTLGEGGGVGVEIVSLQLRNGVSFLWNGLTTIVQGISREFIPCLCPCRQISVIICVGVLVDITLSGMARRTTPHSIRHVVPLIHPNIVNIHLAGEHQMFPILLLERR